MSDVNSDEVEVGSLEETDPIVLDEAEDTEIADPPDSWDAGAHDDDDVREGVELELDEDEEGDT